MSVRREIELSISAAKLTFPLKNDLFLSSFFCIIAFGCINNEVFVKDKHFLIPYIKYDLLFQYIVKIVKFFSLKNKERTSIEECFMDNVLGQYFYINFNNKDSIISFIQYKTQEKEIVLFHIDFDIESFCYFIKAFKVSVIPSLNLSFEQNLFFNYIFKKDIDLEVLKKSPINIITLTTTFVENFALKKRENCYLIELFEYYFEVLVFLKKLENLVQNLGK